MNGECTTSSDIEEGGNFHQESDYAGGIVDGDDEPSCSAENSQHLLPSTRLPRCMTLEHRRHTAERCSKRPSRRSDRSHTITVNFPLGSRLSTNNELSS